MKILVSALLSLGLGCAHSYTCPRRGGPQWLELQSKHFVVRTNLDEIKAQELIAGLEEMRLALTAVWPAPATRQLRTVFAPRNASEFAEFVPAHADSDYAPTYLGFFGNAVSIIDGSKPLNEQTWLRRSLAWEMMQQDLARCPAWVQAGLSHYLDAVTVDRANGVVLAGAPNRELINSLLRAGPIPVQWLLEADPASRDHSYYVESSWLLFNHLMGERTEELRAYLRALERGDEPAHAWRSAFGELELAALDKALKAHLDQKSLTVLHFPLPPAESSSLTSAPLAEGELHAQRAEARLNSGVRFALGEITDEAKEAQREDADNALAIAMDMSATSHDTLKAADAAIARNADDWRLHFLRWSAEEQVATGDVSLLSAHTNRVVARFAKEPRVLAGAEKEALDRALQLQPDNVLVLTASTIAREAEKNQAAALPLAERADALQPGRPLILDLHAVALAGTGHCPEAAALEERALARFDDLRTKQGPVFYGHVEATEGEEFHQRLINHLAWFRAGCR